MAKVLAMATISVAMLAGGAALAADCGNVCDYNHYYGPADYTYIQPGLYGFPVCDWRGNCSPHQVYVNSYRPRGRIIIRPARHVPRPSAE
jgi:hypothetical protein